MIVVGIVAQRSGILIKLSLPLLALSLALLVDLLLKDSLVFGLLLLILNFLVRRLLIKEPNDGS